eukprot:scaffold751_cov395-Prasinococcus_capsulatus_cf.AAC.28
MQARGLPWAALRVAPVRDARGVKPPGRALDPGPQPADKAGDRRTRLLRGTCVRRRMSCGVALARKPSPAEPRSEVRVRAAPWVSRSTRSRVHSGASPAKRFVILEYALSPREQGPLDYISSCSRSARHTKPACSWLWTIAGYSRNK